MPTYSKKEESDLRVRYELSEKEDDHDFASAYRQGLQREEGFFSSPVKATVATAVDLADTVASSAGVITRDDVNNKFLGAIGSPGLTGWYNQNRGAVEVASGVAGILVADSVAGRILRPGGAAMKAIRGTPYVGKVATLDRQYEQAVRLAQATTREAAKRGRVGQARFNESQMTLPVLGQQALRVSPAEARRGVMAAQFKKGLARNATTEGVMALTLNQNDFLYADELAHNVAWGVAGLGIGAGIDRLIGTYTMRKIANSDAIKRLNAAAYDVTGVEGRRMSAASVTDSIRAAAKSDGIDIDHMFVGGGAITDKVTALAIQAAELQKPRGFTERAREVFQRRSSLANPTLEGAMQELNKLTVRGLSGVARSGFGTKAEGLGSPLNESLSRWSASFYGMEEIGTTVENMTRMEVDELRKAGLTKRYDSVQELLTNGGRWKRVRRQVKNGEVFDDKLIPLSEEEQQLLMQEAKELKEKLSWTPVTMLEAGEWAPLELGRIADNYQPRALLEEGGLGEDNVKIWQRKKEKGEPTLGIRSDGELFLPGNGKIERLKIEDMLNLYQIGNKAVRDFVDTGTQFVLPAKPNWFQLDMAEQIIKATKDESSVQFPGAMTRQSAQVEAFAQKVESLRKREQAYKMAQGRGSAEVIDDVKAFEQRVFFNLPRLTNYEAGLLGSAESPIDFLISGMKTGKEVRQMSHADLLRAINDAKQIKGFTEETIDSLDQLHGNSFNFLMDRDGTPIKPMIGYQRKLKTTDYSRDELLVRQITKQAQLRESLMGESADPITRRIVEAITSNPNAQEARKVMELADDQQRSFLPGFGEAAPQSARGSLANSVTSRERRDVDNLVMRAASIIQEDTGRITGAEMRELIQNLMGDRITLVNSARNAGSKMLLNQFHSFRQGWELLPEPQPFKMENGKQGFKFVLDHESLKNQQRFSRMFDGQKIEEGQALLSPSGTEIVLDELGIDVITRMQQLHKAQLEMKNTLLRSQGLREIKEVPFYVPPANTRGKYVGYTFDENDVLIPDMAVVANSPEQLASQAAELQASKSWKNGYVFRQRSDVEAFMSLWDKAQMEFIAPNTTAIQPGKQNFGRTSGSLMNSNAFDEALVTIRDNMVNHGSDVLQILFDDPIKAASARAKQARVEKAVGSPRQTQHSNIFDRYLENLTGRSALGAKDSFFGTLHDAAEDRLNGLLASKKKLDSSQVYQSLKDFLRVSGPNSPVEGEKFNKLAKELGKHMPYKSAQEMVERQTDSRTPAEVAEITSKLSWFEAASRLRWLESMHAVANMGSIVANAPSIIKALQPMAGESIEQAAKRNSSLVMKMALPSGEQMLLPNIPKLMYASMKNAWKVPAKHASKVEKSKRLGYMDQEVAEFQRQWGAIDSKEGWRGFVFGNDAADFNSKTGFQIRNKVAKSGGLDKWLGILSDKSEAFSRQWGMHMGFEIAEAIGIKNEEAAIAFSHDLTNKMIANYDPRNRPEIFQGALGAPIGLFQSYVVNYYQRMFRYLETGNSRALATQYGTQAAIFGIDSVPGWEALNWAFFDRGQVGEDGDPVDSMYNRFGTDAADLLMHGTLSNLPKLFGQDGISLYTRGDSEFRMPVVNLPVADTLNRLWSGVSQGVEQVKSGHGLSLNQTAEIASNMITNRPIAGLLETVGGEGYDTSWDGQVVSQARGTAESVYRALGVRGMRQQTEIERFYANKNAQEQQNAIKTTLRAKSRSAIRAGNYDLLPELFADYVEAGGDERYYSTWVKNAFESGLDTRGERQLRDALNREDGSRDGLISRLLDAQVEINEDDTAEDDYGRQEAIDQVIQQGWQDTPEGE